MLYEAPCKLHFAWLAWGVLMQMWGLGSCECSDGDVRLEYLSDQTNYTCGRVEVCSSGAWGTVCDNNFDINDAQVVCRQLDAGMAISAMGNAMYGEGNGSVVLSDVSCNSSELVLLNCSVSTNFTDCGHDKDASVCCSLAPNPCLADPCDSNAECVRENLMSINFTCNCTSPFEGDGFLCEIPDPCYSEPCHQNASCVRNSTQNSNFTCNCTSPFEGDGFLCEIPDPCYSEPCHQNASCVRNSTQNTNFTCNCTSPFEGDGFLCEIPDPCYSEPCHQNASCVRNSTQNSNFTCTCAPPYEGDGFSCNICNNGDMRLVDGGIPSRGRLETCFNNTWAVLCQELLSNTAASSICNSLGYSHYGAVGINGAYFERFRASTALPILTHHNIMQNCVDERLYPGVVCQDNSILVGNCSHGEMRLADPVDDPGAMSRTGRVEVCVNNAWGAVCRGSFNSPEIDVVCNQEPGFTGLGGTVLSSNTSGPVFLDNLRCLSTESSLLDCTNEQNPVGITNCETDDIVIVQCPDRNECSTENACPSEGMICQNNFMSFTCQCDSGYISSPDGLNCISTACKNGEVRLVIEESGPQLGDDVLRAGRVEVCIEGSYGTVCEDEQWSNKDASVICSQLGFSPYGAIALSGSYFREGSLPTLLGGLRCVGNESNITLCPRVDSVPLSSCGRYQDAGVVCQSTSIVSERVNCVEGMVRLTGGNATRGRLEICINNAWGVVCSYRFDLQDAAVACASLGGFTAVSVSDYQMIMVDAPIFLSSLACEGTETSLLECGSSLGLPPGLYYPLNCDNRSVVELVCQDVNECDNASLNNCSQMCVNTEGGFQCECRGGYEGSVDCVDIDECARSMDNCSNAGNCTNTEGGYSCQCQPGYSGDGIMCDDINECVVDNGGCEQVCVNKNGSFVCLCKEGFRQLVIGSCIDNDECVNGESDCDKNADCVNTPGGFYCSCHSGFILINATCTCMDGQVRLMNGSTVSEGRVEVCVNNTYGTVCDDYWDDLDAQVVCQQLNSTTDLSPIPLGNAYFGSGSGPIFLDDLRCKGDEQSLVNCSRDDRGTHSCDHSEDAGVRCHPTYKCEAGQTRLLLGSAVEYYTDTLSMQFLNIEKFFTFEDNLLAGRVEYCYDSSDYFTICGDLWTDVETSVVCKQLGFSSYGAIAVTSGLFQLNKPRSALFQINCSGSESTLSECEVYNVTGSACTQGDVGVICQAPDTLGDNECNDGEVRLVGGANQLEGRLEVCINRAWGTVCGDGFSQNDANVVCRRLGVPYDGVIVHSDGVFGAGEGAIFLDDLACSGEEETLLECRTYSLPQGLHDCVHSQDVGVTCREVNECLLTNGGCDQVCVNEIDGYSCSCLEGYYLTNDNRTCNASCVDGDTRVNVSDSNDQLRSSNLVYGVVEICLNGTYHTICDEEWDDNDASVVCRSLGSSPYGAIAVHDGILGTLSDHSHLSQVECMGIEESLLGCSYLILESCSVANDAAVICYTDSISGGCEQGSLRFSNDSIHSSLNTTEGRVEVCINNAWGTICRDSFFDSVDAGVMCGQLKGYSRESAEVIITSSPGTGPIFLDKIDCSVDDLTILRCLQFSSVGIVDQACDHSMDVSLRCIDIDECLVNNGNCSHECQNTIGSFECLCELGYQLLFDGLTCEKIDACNSTLNNCSGNATCTNTPIGGFICTCFSGYTGDGYLCEDIDECDNSSSCPRNSLCTDLPGSFLCECNPGFSESTESDRAMSCEDTDECKDGNNGGCSDYCVNTEGSFECQCSSGFELLVNGFNCTDVDECSMDQNNCSDSATCVNTEGGFYCKCFSGYTGDGVTCTDINECAVDNGNCSNTCRNMPGSYQCLCDDGFTLMPNNLTCEDINECETGDNNCSVYAYCENQEGSYDCQCFAGYTEVSRVCTCANGTIRLANGSNSLEGRVEICINNTYGTVCGTTSWDERDAGVVCRQLNLEEEGQFAVPFGDGDFGAGSGPIQLAEVLCDGDESSLLSCLSSLEELANCDHSIDVGVRCQSKTVCVAGRAEFIYSSFNVVSNGHQSRRLHQGGIEYCHNGSGFEFICSEEWSYEESSVLCSSLGFSPYGAIPVTNGLFSANNANPTLYSVGCNGSEITLRDCNVEEIPSSSCRLGTAGVICQEQVEEDIGCSNGDVRLVGGANRLEGRLEVCINRAWGTVCGDGFSEKDANVVCRRLNVPYNGTLVHSDARVFGAGEGAIFLDDLACSGEEETLLECSTYSLSQGLHDCDHSQDVGVTCRDVNECSLNNGGCGHFCANSFGYPYYQCSCHPGYSLSDDNHTCIDNNECEISSPCHKNATCVNTNGSYICECIPGFMGDGVTVCNMTCLDGDIRLSASEEDFTNIVVSAVIGRVEICLNHQYGTIRDDDWTDQDASVVCNQLGLSPSGAVGLNRGEFGTTLLPEVLTRVECSGRERDLLECKHSTDTGNGNSMIDAGVICQNITVEDSNTTCSHGEIRLVSSTAVPEVTLLGELFVEGRVEVCINNAWGTICRDSFFDSVDAGVLCKQLGGYSRESAEVIITSSPGTGPIFLDKIDCSIDDLIILDCLLFSPVGIVNPSCDHSMDVSIKCIDINECENTTLTNCSHNCTNTLNGYKCICDSGYKLIADNKTCEEIFPCESDELNNCQSNVSRCTHTGPGMFECSCLEGFEGNGTHCENINECSDPGFCHDAAVCIDLIGSYYCTCREGYISIPEVKHGDTNLICADIDECSDGTHTCDIVNGYCNNTEGSYECFCNYGYSSNNTINNRCSCEDGQVVLLSDSHAPTSNQTEGRVEVCINNTYSAVCQDRWDKFEALIVCRQLGFNNTLNEVVPVRFASQYYGEGNATIFLDDLACSGVETSLLHCSTGGPQAHTCSSSDVAGVKCGVKCSEGDIRLIVGDDYEYYLQGVRDEEIDYIDDRLSQGRVEVCVNGSYGTICTDGREWSFNEAAVVCRELGFTGNGATPVDSGFFSTDADQALLASVQCNGTEKTLSRCTFTPTTDGECIHEAAIVCQDPARVSPSQNPCDNGDLRLVNDTNTQSNSSAGSVEICINNVWGTVCDLGASSSEAQVVCKQKGFYREGSYSLRESPYGPGNGPVYVEFSGSRCTDPDTKDTLLQCDYRPLGLTSSYCTNHANDMAVVCSTCDRETNEPCQGNAECVYNSVTAYACQCRPGYEGPNCDDIDECATNMLDCHNCVNLPGSYNCTCDNGYQYVTEGNQIFCEDINECEVLNITCHEKATCVDKISFYGCVCNEGYVGDGNTTCEDVDECASGTHQCDNHATCHNLIGGYNCTCGYKYFGNGFNCSCTEEDIRLMIDDQPSKGQSEGRVEVCVGGVFGTVCDRYWNEFDAQVVCRKLQHPGTEHAAVGEVLANTIYRSPNISTPIHLDRVLCRGNETSLLSCESNLIGEGCAHANDAGVKCGVSCVEGDVRLLPGVPNSSEFYAKLRASDSGFPSNYFYEDRLRLGRVEVCQGGAYTTVCKDSSWDNQDASVVCSQLGFSPNGAIAGVFPNDEGTLPVSLVNVNCNGTESFLTNCDSEHSSICISQDFADVICQGSDIITPADCSHGNVRLVKDGQPHPFEGRLEVCINNAWGTVCEKDFDALDTAVVCKALGFSIGRNHQFSLMRFGEDSGGPIFLSSVDCNGDENSLLDCNTFENIALNNCSHTNDISVSCESTCPKLNEENVFYGNYTWPLDTPGEEIVTMKCVHKCGTLLGGNASRLCTGIGKWAETNFTQCPTERTCELYDITQMPLNGATADNIAQAVTDLISEGGSEDQSATNVRMLSDLLADFSEITSLNTQTTGNLVQILDEVQGWPMSARQEDASSLVQALEDIAENLAQSLEIGENVDVGTAPTVAFIGRTVNNNLKNNGQTFRPSDLPGNVVESSAARITLPPEAFEGETQPLSLVFSAFSDANLLPLSATSGRDSRFNIGSPVIGATIVNGSPRSNVTITIPMHNSSYKVPMCTYWNIALRDWMSDGCSIVSVDESTGVVECTCDHLTNFGILSNTDPVDCNRNIEYSNEDFTKCIAKTPNAQVNLNSDLTGPGSLRRIKEREYELSVLYGKELGVVCETDPFFRVEWILENDNTPVEERTSDMGPPSDYSGQLFSFRESQSKVTLRTLTFVDSKTFNIGFQDYTDGRQHYYKCVASNLGVTTEYTVKIQPIHGADLGLGYIRFSTILDQQQPRVSELFAGYISNQIVTEIQDVTAQCSSLPDGRRAVDVERGWDRYDCILGGSGVTSSVINNIVFQNSAIVSNVTYSPMGFCDSELNNMVPHGTYNWTEIEVGKSKSFECFFINQKDPNSNATVSRACAGHREWATYTSGECISETTYRFQQLAEMTITAENVAEVVDELASIVLVAVDLEDQVFDNAQIISLTLSLASDIVSEKIQLTDIELMTNVSEIVSGISFWPSDEIFNSSSNVVLSFDSIAESLVVQDNFTSATIVRRGVVFNGQRVAPNEYVFNNFSTLNQTTNMSSILKGSLSLLNLSTEILNDIEVTLPDEVFKEFGDNSSVGLAFSMHPDSSLFPLDDYLRSVNFVVGTPVVGAIVANTTISNLTDKVTITLPIIVDVENYTVSNPTRCVSWNFTAGPNGNWSDVGCKPINISNKTITCECDHLTNFAIIMDIQARTDSPKDNIALDVISYIGCILSVGGLVLTIITLTGSKKLRVLDITFFQVQFCVSLLCMILTFLIGIDRKENEGFCTFMSNLLQYFVLTSMMWMAAQAVVMFRKLVLVFGTITKNFKIIVSLICWLTPLLFVIAALGTLATGTGTDNKLIFAKNKIATCFISDLYVLLGTLLIPIFLVLIFNLVVFFAVLYVLIRKIRDKQQSGSSNTANYKLIFGIFSISVVLGLTWVFGAFILGEASDAFRYLFVICNAFQGFLFFFFMVIVGTEGRAFWVKNLRLNSIASRVSGRSQATKMSSLGLSSSKPAPTSPLASPVYIKDEVLSSIEKEKLSEANEKSDTIVNMNTDLSVGFKNEQFEMSTLDSNLQDDFENEQHCGVSPMEMDHHLSDGSSNDSQDVSIPMDSNIASNQ